MVRWWIAGLLSLSAVGGAAHAQEDPLGYGNSFFKNCEAPRDFTIKLGCATYVRGLRDMSIVLRWMHSIKEVGSCPSGEAIQDGLGLLVDYLKMHPEYRSPSANYETAGLFWMAMAERYPCWSPQSRQPLAPADKRL
jgi:hypothetical protein